ncbi:MAG: hypothetical protein EPO08_11425 [Rhodospirillaceae bacterium]|nr:MAG: hypothetical protein EPO08_11425 [Rhodospirillaceae bacterium]
MSATKATQADNVVLAIGKLIVRALVSSQRDPDTMREVDVVLNWLEAGLDNSDLDSFVQETGWLIGPYADEDQSTDLVRRRLCRDRLKYAFGAIADAEAEARAAGDSNCESMLRNAKLQLGTTIAAYSAMRSGVKD